MSDKPIHEMSDAEVKAGSSPPVAKPSVVSDKTGHAVMTVDVPAHKAEVSVAHSAIPGCAVAAVEAWDRVRNIQGGDVDFAHSSDLHRRDLMNHAEEVYRSGIVSQGDTSMALFERAVVVIKARQDKEAEAAAKKAAA